LKKAFIKNMNFFEDSDNLSFLGNISRGVERECLRIKPDGTIALTKHPQNLGASLTNPFITTDFSESMIEFITPVFNSPHKLIKFLNDLHVFTVQNIKEERLWPLSMPCLQENQTIPIAEYGNSNLGKFKRLYRIGLHHRYGSNMQIISGLHYNYSMPEDFWPAYQNHLQNQKAITDFKSDGYFNLIRNIHQYGWLISYLFGASPSVCPYFISTKAETQNMILSDNHKNLYLPYATSLRMSHLGYQNKASTQIAICHRHLDSYVEDLRQAVHTKDTRWEKLGIFNHGSRIQVSDSILQIENEYYSSIRPKRRTLPMERPTTALLRRGVEYVELRNVDINPFIATGISEVQVKFLDIFLTWCLLRKSLNCNHETQTHQKYNQEIVVLYGRSKDILLRREKNKIELSKWALEIFEELEILCNFFDKATGDEYFETLKFYKACLEDPARTCSAQLLEETLQDSLFQLGLEKSKLYRDYFLQQKLTEDMQNLFVFSAADSFNIKEKIEKDNSESFEDYLNNYLKN